MIHCKEIDEYIGLVRSGIVVASDDIFLLIENVVNPILNDSTVRFDEETFRHYLDYSQKYYYAAFPYQKFLAAFHFMYYDDGSLCFDEYFYEMGRGNGKDGFIAPLVNFFQTPYFGIKKYAIDIVAMSEDQAEGTFEIVYDMIKESEHKVKMKKHFYASKEVIQNRKTLSRLKFNTSNSKTKDGKRPGCVVFNELHAYEDYKNIKVHTSGLGKIDRGRTIIITTNGDVRGGPFDDYINICEMKLNGELPTIRIFPFLCRITKDEEALDPKMLEKANPSINYMPTLKREILSVLEKIEKKIAPSALIQEYYTKRLNMPKQDETKCVASWENIKATNRAICNLKNANAIVGIDYADIKDFASAGFLIEREGISYWITHSWYCINSPSKNLIKFPMDESVARGEMTFVNEPTINGRLLVEWIVQNAKKYNVLSICMDNFRYNLLKEIFDEYGIYPRTRENPNGLLVLVRSGEFTHSKVSPVIESKFINHKYVWGENKLMNWFTNNTGVKQNEKGNKTYFKISPETRKNDGFMALVHAETEYQKLVESNTSIEIFDAFVF